MSAHERDVLRFNREAWNQIGTAVASPYFDQPFYRNEFEAFCAALPVGARVLDVGCGTGLPIAAEFVRRGFDVTGLDFSDEMVTAARRNVPNATFLRGSVTDLAAREEFAGVFAGHSLIALDGRLFNEAARRLTAALRPAGLIFVAVNEPADRRPRRDDECWDEVAGVPLFVRPYTEDEVATSYRACGVHVVSSVHHRVNSDMYGDEHVLVMRLTKGDTSRRSE